MYEVNVDQSRVSLLFTCSSKLVMSLKHSVIGDVGPSPCMLHTGLANCQREYGNSRELRRGWLRLKGVRWDWGSGHPGLHRI